jgi:hypothetical protein
MNSDQRRLQAEAEEARIDKTLQLPPGEPVLTEARAVRGDVVRVEFKPAGTQRVLTVHRCMQDPLEYYHFTKSYIGPEQYDAGRKLHQLFQHGAFARYRTMNYDPRGGMGDAHGNMLIYPEYLAALNAIRGQMERDVAYAVCCMGHYFPSASLDDGTSVFTSQRTAQRRGPELLSYALFDLAKHFGFLR